MHPFGLIAETLQHLRIYDHLAMANARGIGLLCCSAFIFTTLTLLSAAAAQTPNYTSSSLDSIIASRAIRTLHGSHSGVLYQVTLPDDMSGIKTSVVRVRSASLWTRGLQSPAFRIPPRTTTVPRVKRLAVVYEDLGNRSAAYYNVSGGYSLASPVFGCLAYDASNGTFFGEIREVELRPMNGYRISVVFPTMNSTTMRCVEFRKNGSVHMTETMLNVCSVESTGHFAIVVPSEAALSEGRRRGWWWGLVVMVCVGGVVGLVLVGLVGVGILKVARRRRREEMEVHAEREGEALGSVMVGSSKMPAARMVRTQPAIENGGAPCLRV